MMTTTFKTMDELIKLSYDDPKECIFPITVIPNYMGINLCSVEGIAWTKQDDGQLVSLTIHFLPNPNGDERTRLK